MMQLTQTQKTFAIISWLNVLIGAVMIAWTFFIGPLSTSFQIGYFSTMLLLTGIPHGGLDHIIAKTTAIGNHQKFNLSIFLGRYLIAIIIYSVCWFFIPSFSLLFFIIISAWHFGETDIASEQQKIILSLLRFIWGFFVLMLILLMHPFETTEVLLRISINNSHVMDVWQFCKQYSTPILLSLGCINILLLAIAITTANLRLSFYRISNLLIILLMSAYLPLLPSFALYFGGWHAIRSFELIFEYLSVSKNITGKNPLQLWTQSLPMSGLAAITFVIATLLWNRSSIDWDPLPIVFIFLSIITLPHLDVMDQMIRKEKVIQ